MTKLEQAKKILIEQAKKIILECDSYGFATVARGIFLETRESLLEQAQTWADEDPGKAIDYSACPYWITTDNGILPIGITGENDLDLLNAIMY